MATNSDTPAKILAAADDLFGELGFDSTSTRLIAERSGVNKALIHYHFQSKQDLFHEVLDRYYDRLGRTMRSALEAEGSLHERLHRLIDTYVDFLHQNQRFSRMVQREISQGRHVERILGHMLPLFQTGTTLIQQVWPATLSGDLAAPNLLVSFYGMVVSYFTYSPVVAGLMNIDPLSAEGLEQHKRHLFRLTDLVIDEVQREGRTP